MEKCPLALTFLVTAMEDASLVVARKKVDCKGLKLEIKARV